MTEKKSSPGYKTTEFWLSLIVVVLGAFMASGMVPGDHVAIKVGGMVMAVLSGMGYTAGRSKIKAAAEVSNGKHPPVAKDGEK